MSGIGVVCWPCAEADCLTGLAPEACKGGDCGCRCNRPNAPRMTWEPHEGIWAATVLGPILATLAILVAGPPFHPAQFILSGIWAWMLLMVAIGSGFKRRRGP